MSSFPKVLIISADPFNNGNATGITLSSLFYGWDKNAIAQVYMSDKEPDKTVCNQSYKLGTKIAPFDYYIRKMLGVQKKAEVNLPSAVTLNRLQKSWKSRLHLELRVLADFSPVRFPKETIQWIKNFNPDVIYCALGSTRMVTLARMVSENIKKPIVPHFMDDWPATLYTQNELFGLGRKIFMKRFRKMLSHCKEGLCISEQMACEYQQRYALRFEPFIISVDDNLFEEPEPQNPEEGIITLMYIGGLHLNRWKSLHDIASAIEQLNGSKQIILKIYCPDNDEQIYHQHFKDTTKTFFEGSLSSSQVPEMLKKATLVLHVESFEENFAQYTRLSISTKIPQYMAAGKPIFGYGPKQLASMEHIDRAKAGIIVSENKVEVLIQALSKLSYDAVARFDYAKNGYVYAKAFHSRQGNLKRLVTVLKRSAQG